MLFRITPDHDGELQLSILQEQLQKCRKLQINPRAKLFRRTPQVRFPQTPSPSPSVFLFVFSLFHAREPHSLTTFPPVLHFNSNSCPGEPTIRCCIKGEDGEFITESLDSLPWEVGFLPDIHSAMNHNDNNDEDTSPHLVSTDETLFPESSFSSADPSWHEVPFVSESDPWFYAAAGGVDEKGADEMLLLPDYTAFQDQSWEGDVALGITSDEGLQFLNEKQEEESFSSPWLFNDWVV